MADPVVRRRYSITVGMEFGLLGADAAVLGTTGQDRWIPVWICTGLASATAPSTITGAGAGLCLLAFGVATMLTARRRPAAKIEVVPSLPSSARWLTVTSISTGRGQHE
jgi:hypothetical protein